MELGNPLIKIVINRLLEVLEAQLILVGNNVKLEVFTVVAIVVANVVAEVVAEDWLEELIIIVFAAYFVIFDKSTLVLIDFTSLVEETVCGKIVK